VGTKPTNTDPVRHIMTTPDGVELAAYELGGDGPDLLLFHATGFCASVMAPLAAPMTDRFRCWSVDLRAHGRSGRPLDGNFDWSGFATDVLTTVDHLGLDRPYGFGHSCGGAALLLAEERRPGTFGALYCFEPVVLPIPPSTTPSEDNPLSQGALRRRESFPSRADAFVNFSSKPPFMDLDPDVLEAYVDGGFETVPAVDGGDGQTIRLRCRREDEAQIYAHGGCHDAYLHLDEVACPVSLACGERTDSFGVAVMEADAERLRSSRVEVIPEVGHFGPLQRPDRVARSAIASFEGASDATTGEVPGTGTGTTPA
jgi:pimeloyl-ACP methyl ester carboxylesterase